MKGKKFMSDLKLYSDYLKWKPETGKYESWEEAQADIINGHREKYIDYNEMLEPYLQSALESQSNQTVLASQRNLQFRSSQINQHNARMFNCTSTHICRNRVFQEIFYLGLCGCGVGAGLLIPFVDNLSRIQRRHNGTVTYIIQDSIEGWADALGVLLSSYFVDKQPFPEYAGYEIKFDFSLIRPKGAFISGGFKAPGPDGLKTALEAIENLLEKWITKEGEKIRPILAFDIICFSSNAVLSGGVRRSALNMIVDPYDEEMILAKVGNWRKDNPQRERSNNSVIIKRDLAEKPFFKRLIELNEGIADIGFVFANSWFDMFNPCLSADSMITVKNENDEIYQAKIKELADKKTNGDKLPLALTMNEKTGAIEWDSISDAFLTKTNASLIEIELEDGTKLKLTPDHKVYTENRGWINAAKLTYDDVLVGIED